MSLSTTATISATSTTRLQLQNDKDFYLSSASSPFLSLSSPSTAVDAAKIAAAAARRKRRQALVKRKAAAAAKSNNTPTKKQRCEDDEDKIKKVFQSGIQQFILPTVEGVSEVARQWRSGGAVAIPTECTYEVYRQQPLHQQSGCAETGKYVLVPPSAKHPFLVKCLPPRHYAMRDATSGKATSKVYLLSEALHVLQKISAKVWPGPVTIQVEVPLQSKGTAATPVDPSLLTRYNDRNYLTLRCPCHPLAVKVTQQVNKDDGKILVGSPLQDSEGMYITRADQAFAAINNNIDAVLQGEEQREVFAVPTCEYANPWPVAVRINVSDRLVCIVHNVSKGINSRIVENNNLATVQRLKEALRDKPTVTTSDHYCSKSSFSSFDSGSGSVVSNDNSNASAAARKQRLMQSILAKWNVVQHG